MSKNKKGSKQLSGSVVKTDRSANPDLDVRALDPSPPGTHNRATRITRFIRERLWLIPVIGLLAVGAFGSVMKCMQD
ncbi:MAG TPA: hypothetical protein PKA76_15295 [Pirellulaceae bacterium]|nr:hypothetical protein [Pyrinomonadaceae bacterium]HMP65587.1 hypothetical protein [Pyrinomonadaceae bacterium]HMP70710.1 hypothetical protein [Pirellulaceae bacterium]